MIRNRYDITALQETFWNLDFIDENKTKHWSVALFTSWSERDRRGRDRMVEKFTTTYVTSAYHHYRYEFESRSSYLYLVH